MPHRDHTCRVRRSMADPPAIDENAPGYWASDGNLLPREREEFIEDDVDSVSNLSVMALRRRGVPDNWVDYVAQYPEGRDIRYKRYILEKQKADNRENRVRMNQKLAELARRRRGIPDDGPPIEMAEIRGLVDMNGEVLPQ